MTPAASGPTSPNRAIPNGVIWQSIWASSRWIDWIPAFAGMTEKHVPPHPPNKYFVRTSIAVPAPTCTSDLS
jgi:hypothetical protein